MTDNFIYIKTKNNDMNKKANGSRKLPNRFFPRGKKGSESRKLSNHFFPMGKKGMSPLIATILLLVFAIGLGVIVMNWGRAQVEAASKCAIDIELDVVELNEIPELCFSGAGEDGVLHFIIENGPNIDIEELQLSVIGTKNVLNMRIDERVEIGFSLLKDIPYNFNEFGEIRQVRIIPKINLYPEEDPILCPEQAIVLDNIRSC